jgi:hypothetical protein
MPRSLQMGSVRKTSKQVEWGTNLFALSIFRSVLIVFPVFLDPPHILDKVDFGNGTATLADFDSESTMDQEQRTPETTPRYVRIVQQAPSTTLILGIRFRAWFTASHDHSDPNNVKTTYNSQFHPSRDVLCTPRTEA